MVSILVIQEVRLAREEAVQNSSALWLSVVGLSGLDIIEPLSWPTGDTFSSHVGYWSSTRVGSGQSFGSAFLSVHHTVDDSLKQTDSDGKPFAELLSDTKWELYTLIRHYIFGEAI